MEKGCRCCGRGSLGSLRSTSRLANHIQVHMTALKDVHYWSQRQDYVTQKTYTSASVSGRRGKASKSDLHDVARPLVHSNLIV